MSIPPPDVVLPAALSTLAPGAELEPVWLNELGGVTVRARTPHEDRYIKYGPRNAETSMREEAERMRWAGTYTPVPEVIAWGEDATHEWMMTKALPFDNPVQKPWIDDPASTVRTLGAGLRALHEALPVQECPFDWGVAYRVDRSELSGTTARDFIERAPGIDRLVVCHGDACAPNTLIGPDGAWAAHLDLGSLGVADRWADLAVASRNLLVDFGPGWEETFFAGYGIEPDDARIDFYAKLWDRT